MGIWQFMGSRADDYNLKRSWWLDEREDPEKSTVAAARHLKDLYREFGDWYLAMAAYDSGDARIQRAIAATGYADFWELYKRGVLPRETRNYVPIILATALIAKNPSQYGINQIVEDQPQQFDSVTLEAPLDLRLAAECADTSVSEIQALNPSVLRLVTPRVKGFTLHIPAGTTERFQQAISLIPPEKRLLWRYHRLTAGETLDSLAHNYGLHTGDIVRVNRLSNDTELQAGQRLIIPITHPLYVETTRRYRVRRGDTLYSVARAFGVTEEQLRRWNHIRNSQLRPGRVVYVRLVISDAEAGIDGSRQHRKSNVNSSLGHAKQRSPTPRRNPASPQLRSTTHTS
jgi:membrane-bound lytic murein transglycosylase D